MSKRHLILIGLSGSGKSTAGRVAADELKTRLSDVDHEVEALEGMTISEIFATRGEAAFRQAERQLIQAHLAGEPRVLVPGGGWAAQPGSLQAVRGSALTIYLAVSPDVAAARLGTAHGRPLLGRSGDLAAALRDMLAVRERFYSEADATVETDDLDARRVGRRLAELARQSGGW